MCFTSYGVWIRASGRGCFQIRLLEIIKCHEEICISSCQWRSLYLLLRLLTWTFLNYYLWIPKYQHRQEPQRTAQTLKKKSADNFLSFCHPAGGRRSTQTVNYRLLVVAFPGNAWFAFAQLGVYPVALSAIFHSLRKKGVGCHSVWYSWVTTKGYRKPSSACCTLRLPAGVTGLLIAGGGSLDIDLSTCTFSLVVYTAVFRHF